MPERQNQIDRGTLRLGFALQPGSRCRLALSCVEGEKTAGFQRERGTQVKQISCAKPCCFRLALPDPFRLTKGVTPCHGLMQQKSLLQIQFNETEDFSLLSNIKFLSPHRQTNCITKFMPVEGSERKRL